jgi:hypothetical protein
VIQNATAQELAAVNALFHRLADGREFFSFWWSSNSVWLFDQGGCWNANQPFIAIAGGDGDAFDSIDRFTQGNTGDVIEGVSCEAHWRAAMKQTLANPISLVS